MNRFKYNLIMCGIFVSLYTIATMVLEFFEGNKITTTLYYGLRNIGFGFVLYNLVFSFLLYLISFLPLTLLLNKFVESLFLRIIVYSFIGGISGIWIFNHLYNYQDFIRSYEFNKSSAIIVFGVSGTIYALVEYYLFNRITYRSNNQS